MRLQWLLPDFLSFINLFSHLLVLLIRLRLLRPVIACRLLRFLIALIRLDLSVLFVFFVR